VVDRHPEGAHDRTTDEVVDGVPVRRVTADLPFELPVHPRPGHHVGRIVREGGSTPSRCTSGCVPVRVGGVPALVAAECPTVVTVHSLWGPGAAPRSPSLDR
jgi:hypothetical protein